ncbi:amidohydrolase [Gluconobacter roseus]|uniref:Amidohydrolase n=1 Tax=Gluconobacter roseus NBRC 3990 TaxID=1307950 RepID=A0A4Y3M7J7_9PROT|nr:amidohydrolase [Gluconobacter roseus]KXV44408.1 histidine kinase [Gluconobacter roseus]GBR47958.1 putative metal-dependent hydrolase [Gluconobacter roseus NBRC 3990]GEB03468.1 amidohydrolase [Gluconobacter roseus NBRC 3990]GLP93923.1 amidohydrolase [Gluconobacter roseus NBRC 3990]
MKILYNATVVLPGNVRRKSAILIREGRIAGIGDHHALLDSCAGEVEQVDLGGACVLPGFIDSHLHLLMGAEYLSNIGLRDARTMAEVVRRVEAFAAAHPERDWLLGLEWSYGYPDLPPEGFDRAMLDAVVPDRPVFLRSGMAHAAWANSRALELAGIDASTPDPEGGEIVRRPDGSPSGWLKEEAAKLVSAHVPPMDEQMVREGLERVLGEMARCGITRVESAAYDEGLFPILGDMEALGELTCRIGVMVEMPPPQMSEKRLAEIEGLRRRYHSPMLSLDGVKFFLDGVLESHTACMPQGYADRPDETGTLVWKPEAYKSAVRQVSEAGFQIWTHAIGSGAIQLALDAYAQDPAMTRSLRHRVEHVEIPFAEDIPRFRELGAVACLQPVMVAPSDEWMGMQGVWAQRVRESELERAFPNRALLDAGSVVAFGTDWPIVSLSPLRGISKAVTRRSLAGGAAFVPQQAITVPEALYAYTAAGAFACHREAQEGSIEVGKLADLVVLSSDPADVPPGQIPEISVLMTMLGGRVVYDARPDAESIL